MHQDPLKLFVHLHECREHVILVNLQVSSEQGYITDQQYKILCDMAMRDRNAQPARRKRAARDDDDWEDEGEEIEGAAALPPSIPHAFQ